MDSGSTSHLNPKHENVLDILVSAEYLTNMEKAYMINWSIHLNIFCLNYRMTSRLIIWMKLDFLKKSCAQF